MNDGGRLAFVDLVVSLIIPSDLLDNSFSLPYGHFDVEKRPCLRVSELDETTLEGITMHICNVRAVIVR